VSLLFRAGHNDVDAFETLYKKYFPLVRAFLARHNGHSDCLDDMAQEVFLRAWERRKAFLGISTLKTYLFGIGKHVMLDEWARNSKRSRTVATRQANSSWAYTQSLFQPELQLHNLELSAGIDRAKRKLPAKQREAFELAIIQNIAIPEAAKLAKCTTDQFRDRLYRARKRLRQLLRSFQQSSSLGHPTSVHARPKKKSIDVGLTD